MIASIQDAHVLRDIGPHQLAAYLRSRAWSQVELIGDKASVWTLLANGRGEFEILLPLDATLEEYPRRVSEALHTLEVAEQRSQLDILLDITTATSDVLRVRLVHGLIENGSLPLEHGVQMVRSARDLALAAACATSRPRAVYGSRKPQEAIDYLSGLRMGQTAAGSFVVTIQSAVPPRAQLGLFADASNKYLDEPFERRVLLTLAHALTETRHAITYAAGSGDFQPFQNAVRSGISANLCDALVGLSIDGSAEEIDLELSWSPTRQAVEKTPTRFQFRRDMFPVLREASRLLRESALRDDFALFGTVTGLRREEGARTGRVTVSALVDNLWRKVRMDLGDEDYRKAVKAHEERELVEGTGELVKDKRTYFLRNVRDFDLFQYPDTDTEEDQPEQEYADPESDPFADE